MSKNHLSDELHMKEDGHRILGTHLHRLGAIRRFYLNLADKMDILETEDLEKPIKDIRKYLEKQIKLLLHEATVRRITSSLHHQH